MIKFVLVNISKTYLYFNVVVVFFHYSPLVESDAELYFIYQEPNTKPSYTTTVNIIDPLTNLSVKVNQTNVTLIVRGHNAGTVYVSLNSSSTQFLK